jgi:plasmid maintenance system antidote protein VapI
MLRENVIRALDACRISDAALIKAVGCDRQELAMILNGKVEVEAIQAERLAKYFGTDSEWWFRLRKN